MIVKIADIPIQLECKNKKWGRSFDRLFHDYLSPHTTPNYFVNVIINRRKNKKILLHFTRMNSAVISFPSSLKYLLRLNFYLKVVFTIPLLKYDGVLIHSSSLVNKKRGFLFVGKQNQGKSTIQKIAKKFKSYNDDFSIVRKTKNSFYLYPSPFIETNSRTEVGPMVKIKKIFFIQQATKTKIMPIDSSLSSLYILSNILRPNNLKSLQESYTINIKSEALLVKKLVEKVSCYKLMFEKNKKFLRFL